MRSKNRHYLKAVIRKVLAAFILVSIAIFLGLTITRFSFRELMGTVNELSEPNEKLTILNSVFKEITTLDQLQRAEAIKNPHKPYNTFLNQSASLNDKIDSLKTLPWDTIQLKRLDKMQDVLAARNKLFFSYLKVKAALLDNREFSAQLDTLTAILQNEQTSSDSALISTHTKTITTYLPDTIFLKKSEQRSFLKKLFSKRKPESPKVKVEQQQTVVVDTLALDRENEALVQIEKIMQEMEVDQKVQRKNLQRQELELVHANSLFINQLLGILHEVENEELQRMRENNNHAVSVVNQSISRTNILMLSFFIAAAILVYLIFIDISKSNYYKEQLEKARDEAEQLTKIKQRFLANMSHELRTPLQSIIGFAEQLKQKSSGRQEEVDAIYSSSEHLLHIVNEVLDYSRISSGNFILSREKFKILTLIKEVEAAMRVQAERKNLTFVLDSEKSSEYTVAGDPFRLKQILYNLISNAIKFTHRGFIKLSVNTIDEGDHVLCLFEVVDTGIGIEKEDLDRIFNQFEQANSFIAKHYGGTGLGLTIVKSLVDAQQGILEVSSDPGIGSCFRVELRFEKVNVSAIPDIQYKKNIATPSFHGKVIVIDDDQLILKLCSLILKKHEVDFTTFTNPHILLEQPPDPKVSHIFLDIRMPEINGVDLCHALQRKYSRSVRFIALTAHVLPEERESLIQEGFDSILPKPFHETDLLNALQIRHEPKVSTGNDQPNLSMLKKMTMGDESLFHSIVSQFLEETMEDLVQIKENAAHENGRALREIIHKMAGRFAQLGMESIAARLQTIENRLVSGCSLSELSAELASVTKKVNETVIQIRLTSPEQLS